MVSDMWAMFHHVPPCFHVQFFSYLSPKSMTHCNMCRMHDAMTSRWGDWLPHWPYQPVWQTRVELRSHWAKLDRIRNWKRVPAKKNRQLCEAIPEFVVNFLGCLNMLLRSSGRAGTVGSSQIAVVGELGPGPNSSSVLSRTLRKGKVIHGYWCALEWFLQQSGIVSWIVGHWIFALLRFDEYQDHVTFVPEFSNRLNQKRGLFIHMQPAIAISNFLMVQTFRPPVSLNSYHHIWTARCIINCINYDLNFLKPLDGQTPPFAVTAVRMSKLDFETTLHLGDMAKSLAKAQLVQSKYANMNDFCVFQIEWCFRQGPRRWNSWRWREAKKSMDRILCSLPLPDD